MEKFGGKIRNRVCGILVRGGSVLLINHKGLYGHDFWVPPGGGIELGETSAEALEREFMEECALSITVGKFLFTCELVRPPLHAFELFFKVEGMGLPQLGQDPELGANQIMSEARFWSAADLLAVPNAHKHGILSIHKNPEQLLELSGFYPLT